MLKAIATRIKNVLPEIIHHVQTGQVKGCVIGETIRSIFDVMGFTAEENIPGLMIFIDFQKAFHSVQYLILIKNFLRWVKTFYENIQSCVMNGFKILHTWTWRAAGRSTFPLPLHCSSRNFGITIGKEETKLLQYTDDITAVSSDTKSARVLFALLDLFIQISGLNINPTKTEGMQIGSSKESKANPFNIK